MQKEQPDGSRGIGLVQRLRSFAWKKLNPDRIVPASRFEWMAPIGEGCMGVVYKALDKEAGEQVAIKVAKGSESARIALEREVKALSKLQHPNIARMMAHGRLEGLGFESSRFMATEYLDGITLDKAIRDGGRLPWEIAKPVLMDICLALAATHNAGLIHRDIKPSNIFLTTNKTKLMDFGVSEKAGFNLSLGFSPGNMDYSAPEVYAGNADFRSDIYSLGMVMHRIMSGKSPENPVFCMTRETVDVSGIDPGLASIILRASSKTVDQRYQSAKDMWADIARL
jgi:serine/threonine protein kinase